MGASYRDRHIVESSASIAATSQPAPEPEPETVDDEDLTLAQLKEKAEALGLPIYGTKADLRDRIAEHDTDAG